MVYRWIYFHQ